jgi:hypothetical protein
MRRYSNAVSPFPLTSWIRLNLPQKTIQLIHAVSLPTNQVFPSYAVMDQCVALRIKSSCILGVSVAIAIVDFQELLGAEHDKVRELDHRILLRVNRVAELHNPLDAVGYGSFKPPHLSDAFNVGVKLLFLIDDEHATS